jgi:hypothetical protein
LITLLLVLAWRGAASPYTTVGSGDYVVGVVVRGADGQDTILPIGPTTVEPSPTLESTVLPTVAATLEPKPTETPTATPAADRCWGTVTADTLNVRATPGGTILGQVHKNDILAFESRLVVSGVAWYQIQWTDTQIGWVSSAFVTIGLDAQCGFTTSWGIWAGPGANRDELVHFGNQLTAAGVRPAATVYGDADTARALHRAGWVVAWRAPVGDCPDNTHPAEISARVWWSTVMAGSGQVTYTWLVISNECWWPSGEYLRDWISEIVDRARAAGVPRIVPTVFNSGAPDLAWSQILRPVLIKLRDAGGCIGFNAYPVKPDAGLADYDSWNQYTVYRYELLDLPTGLPVCITEFAAGDGNQLVDFQDIAGYVRRVNGTVLWATAWYDAMELSAWPRANLRGRLAELAQVYVQ